MSSPEVFAPRGAPVVEVFPWNANFETGLPEVDVQHRRLVALLNGLVNHLALEGSTSGLDRVFDELKDYTATHFRDEEALWLQYFGGDGWETGHHRTHGDFIGKLQALIHDGASQPLELLVADLVTWLTTWLAKHILESDKRLALVVLAMRAGIPLAQAKVHASDLMASGSRMLVETVMAMSEGIATRTVLLMQEIGRRKQAEADLHAAHVALRAATKKSERLERLLRHARAPLAAYASALAAGPLASDETQHRALVRGLREALGVLDALDDDGRSEP